VNIGGLATSSRIQPSPEVLLRESGGRCSTLRLSTGTVFGFDEMNTRMLKLLLDNGSIDAAHQAMIAEYDVDPQLLREGLAEVVESLVSRGIVQVPA
jgi:hypothetical protein